MPSVWTHCSLVPRALPDFISQLWRKIGRRPWDQNYVGGGGLEEGEEGGEEGEDGEEGEVVPLPQTQVQH